ncbi:MAG TPA: PQQ-binding-like beta-propeller repeat protein [Vicinamibacteria bacterium]
MGPIPALLLGLLAIGIGDDAWPGLWGPRGDGSAAAEARLPAARELRVREAWRRPLGSGFAAIAVARGRGYTGISEGGHDHVVAFDAATGREVWRARLGDTYRGHDGSKDGPISTPALSADAARAFVVSAQGVLFALDSASGKIAWQRDLKVDLAVPPPFYGFGTSPLISGKHVIVQGGGEKAGLVALDQASGEVAWSVAHSKTSGYASPVLATLGGGAQIVTLANDMVYGVRPQDGSLVWSHPTGWTDESLRAPLVLPGDRVLISGTNEAKLIELKKEGDRLVAKEAWKSPRLKNSLSPTVFHEGWLYGFSAGHLLCVDPATADVAWRQRVYAGSLILVDGHLLILGSESGELRVGRATPKGYEERLKAPVFNAGATSVTGPSFAGGRVFLRNVEELVALDIIG